MKEGDWRLRRLSRVLALWRGSAFISEFRDVPLVYPGCVKSAMSHSCIQRPNPELDRQWICDIRGIITWLVEGSRVVEYYF